MKTLSFVAFLGLAGTLSLFSSPAQFGPLWHGPQPTPQWHGLLALAAPATAAKPVPAAPEVQAPIEDTPRWVGYYRRGTEWYVRLICADKQSYTMRRGATTPDGWLVSNIAAQANRVQSVTVTRNGVERTLTLESE